MKKKCPFFLALIDSIQGKPSKRRPDGNSGWVGSLIYKVQCKFRNRAVDKGHNTKAVLGPKLQSVYGWSLEVLGKE